MARPLRIKFGVAACQITKFHYRKTPTPFCKAAATGVRNVEAI